MDSQVLSHSWGGLSCETEIVLTKQPNTAALTVVFRVRDPELRWLKFFPTAVTTGLNHLGSRKEVNKSTSNCCRKVAASGATSSQPRAPRLARTASQKTN